MSASSPGTGSLDLEKRIGTEWIQLADISSSGTCTVSDLSQFKEIMLIVNYNANSGMSSSDTYPMSLFKIAPRCASSISAYVDGNNVNYGIYAKYISDTSIDVTFGGNVKGYIYAR